MFTAFFVFLGWFIGGFVSGISGFGAMMLALPVLTLGLAPKDAILTCCIVAGPCCIQLAWLYRRYVYWPDMKWLWISCVPGCILGTLTLMVLPVGWLQIGISLLICIFLLVQLLNQVLRIKFGQGLKPLREEESSAFRFHPLCP